MSKVPDDKVNRHRLIREIIARNEVHSHDQLLALLEVESVITTQPTLSRDLRELGAQKTGRGYRLEPADADAAEQRRRLRPALKGNVESAARSGTLLVVRARGGAMGDVAAALQAGLGPAMLGMVRDGETIFVATPSSADARRALAWVLDAAGQRPARGATR